MGEMDAAGRLRGLTGPGVDRITLSTNSVRDLEAALDELERLRAATVEAQQQRAILPRLYRTAWRTGWADHADAMQSAQQQAVRNRDVFEARFGVGMQQWLPAAPQQPEREGGGL